jgi:hypothetical protein
MKSPEMLHPDLTMERLRLVGAAVARGRDGAQSRAEELEGDNNYSTGCVGFVRSRRQIELLASKFKWCTIKCGGNMFVFTVGDVPLRFCHDDPDGPTPRHRRTGPGEEPQLQSLFGFMEGEPGFVLRVVLETDMRGMTEAVHLVQLCPSEGDVIHQWEIYRRADELPQPAELPPITLSPKDGEAAASDAV